MILDKAKMAHEWVMKYGKVDSNYNRENTVQLAWEYADAMQAEEDKRAVKLPDVFFDTKQNKEWQPDWSQAPENANYWSITDYGKGKWHSAHAKTPRNCGCAFSCENSLEWDAPDFGYTGNWQESLRKRPQ